MEFQPDGIVHLKLDLPDGTQELYTWNKVRIPLKYGCIKVKWSKLNASEG